MALCKAILAALARKRKVIKYPFVKPDFEQQKKWYSKILLF
jgi:hypothetical protein